MQDSRGDLLRFLAARTGDPAEAEDLLQALWLKVADLHLGPIANPRSYLFRAANNLAIDHARARHRAMRRDRDWLTRDDHTSDLAERRDPAADAEGVLLAAEEVEQVQKAIAALPEGARRALVAFRFDGLGQGEIAARMGISRSGVEKHLALAMKRLRQSLADCGYFDAAPSYRQGPNGEEEA